MMIGPTRSHYYHITPSKGITTPPANRSAKKVSNVTSRLFTKTIKQMPYTFPWQHKATKEGTPLALTLPIFIGITRV